MVQPKGRRAGDGRGWGNKHSGAGGDGVDGHMAMVYFINTTFLLLPPLAGLQ